MAQLARPCNAGAVAEGAPASRLAAGLDPAHPACLAVAVGISAPAGAGRPGPASGRSRVSAPPRPNPLGSSRAFRRLWIARTISQVGDGIALVALVLLVQGTQRTGVAVGTLLLASSLPRFLGPFAGVVADRVEQRALMIGCDLGNAAVFLAIAGLEPSFPWLLALVAASAVLNTLFAPAGRSAIPALVAPRTCCRPTPGWEHR